MNPKEIDSFDWLIALYKEENKWFDEQVNAINARNRNLTVENLLKVGGRELISKNSYLAKEGFIRVTNDDDELPVLTQKARKMLMYVAKDLLSRQSEYHRKLYARELRVFNF